MPSNQSSDDTPQGQLHRLLLRMFSSDELRRFIRFAPDGEAMSLELPGPTASPAVVATAVVTTLAEHEAIDAALFDRLVAERPRRDREIREIQALFAAGTEAGGKVIHLAHNGDRR
ncbi:hypothetical protein [Nannocystis punicea]|uniref:Uncharacterized protein n=1 Tax=Nannocystis punicea TaxID=2995304 RepID=A0ABY7GXI9_9BACT|nr:hypothetical protein [Nannocystis poenicansa]WAS91594.1 hypothetical protein O0S08_35890 [Nannocystis poenicansa]